HPDWCRVAWESFHEGASIRLHLAYEDDRLVGILPTCRRRMNRFGLFLPVSEALAGARGDYSAPVIAPGAGADVAVALFASALNEARSAGAFVFANIPDDHGVPAMLEDYLR